MQLTQLLNKSDNKSKGRVFTSGGTWSVTVQIPSAAYVTARFWIVFEKSGNTFPQAGYLTPSANQNGVIMSIDSDEIPREQDQAITWMLETLDAGGLQKSIHGFRAHHVHITRPDDV